MFLSTCGTGIVLYCIVLYCIVLCCIVPVAGNISFVTICIIMCKCIKSRYMVDSFQKNWCVILVVCQSETNLTLILKLLV